MLLIAVFVCTQGQASTVLAVIGDYGEPGAGGTSVANMVGSSAWQTDYVLTLGDNNSGNVAVGNPDWETLLGARYGQFMKKRSGPGPNPYPHQTSATQRFFPVVGDHDVSGDIAGYLDYFHDDPGAAAGRLPAGVHSPATSYYDFTLPLEGAGSVHVFAMDSESYASSAASQAAQIAWLREGLQGSTATWNFVLVHRPPFSSGGVHGSQEIFQLPFQKWGAHAVLAGHDHLYERLSVTDVGQNEMLYFVNGLGGANIYPFGARAAGSQRRYNGYHGAMRITVSEQQALFEFLEADFGEGGTSAGSLIDAFTLLKSDLPTPPLLTADFNDDGFVNQADLAIWETAFGLNDLADADGDGDSDGQDLLAWQTQLFSVAAVTNPATAVAEPVSSSLLAAAAILLPGIRRIASSRDSHTRKVTCKRKESNKPG